MHITKHSYILCIFLFSLASQAHAPNQKYFLRTCVSINTGSLDVLTGMQVRTGSGTQTIRARFLHLLLQNGIFHSTHLYSLFHIHFSCIHIPLYLSFIPITNYFIHHLPHISLLIFSAHRPTPLPYRASPPTLLPLAAAHPTTPATTTRPRGGRGGAPHRQPPFFPSSISISTAPPLLLRPPLYLYRASSAPPPVAAVAAARPLPRHRSAVDRAIGQESPRGKTFLLPCIRAPRCPRPWRLSSPACPVEGMGWSHAELAGRRRVLDHLLVVPSSPFCLPLLPISFALCRASRRRNMEDVETDPKMATVFQLTDAGHFSLKVERYSDGGGVSRPGCGWSQQHQIEEYFFLSL
jgi:hypothetical protein